VGQGDLGSSRRQAARQSRGRGRDECGALIEAKKLAGLVGGVEKARKALDALARLL